MYASPVRTPDTCRDADSSEAPRRPLSCERIVGAALDLVDANCLAQLSMRRLGAELGVEAMSLYRYFPSKALLLDALVCRVLSDLQLPEADDADWEPAVRNFARSLRTVARRHPDLLPLLATAGDATATMRAVEDRMAALWRRAGLAGKAPRRAQRVVQAYVIGASLAAPGAVNVEDDRGFELGLDALLTGFRTRFQLAATAE